MEEVVHNMLRQHPQHSHVNIASIAFQIFDLILGIATAKMFSYTVVSVQVGTAPERTTSSPLSMSRLRLELSGFRCTFSGLQ